MPSDMFLRGKHDAEADALDDSFYQYYYDYRLAYDEVVRLRQRTRRRALLGKIGRMLMWIVPALLVLGGGIAGYDQWKHGGTMIASLGRRTATASPSRTSRPTLPPSTPVPTTPTADVPVLRASGFAVITGTDDAALRIHKAPGKDTAAPGRIGPGKQVHILEGPQKADGLDWWKVESPDATGWAAGQYLAPVPNK